MIDLGNIDPAGLVLFTLPVIVFVLSIIAQLIFNNRLAILIINFIIWVIAAFTVFNTSFLIYTLAYTVIALIGVLIADLILKITKKRN